MHGTRRAFLAVFLLSLVTAGLYAWYYWYVTFRDVARQTGARHAASTYFGGLLFFAVAVAAPLLLEPDRIMFAIWGLALVGAAVSWTLYWIIGFRQLHAARARKRLPRGIGLGGYLAWSIPGMFLLGLGPLIAWGKLNASFNGYWARFSR